MWIYENLELFVGAIFASGIGLHFAIRRMERHNYLELRGAYESAVREAREAYVEPPAVVRAAELHRAFMSSRMPGWFEGFGRCLGRWFKFCAVFILVAFFFKGPIERGELEYAEKQARNVAAARSAKAKVAGAPTTGR